MVLLANPFSPLPYVNFTTVSGGGSSHSRPVNGVHAYLAFSVPSTPVSSFLCLHLFLCPLLISPLFAAYLPLAWVIFGLRLCDLGDDNAWMFSILSSCQSMSHH